MTSSAAGADPPDAEADPLWRFATLGEFTPPAASLSEFARTGLRGLLQRFRTAAPPAPEVQDATLDELGAAALEKLVPAPPNDAMAEALASPWLDIERPIAVAVSEQPSCTHYRVRAYPIAAADQFRFASDVTVRGKSVIAELVVRPAAALPRVHAVQRAQQCRPRELAADHGKISEATSLSEARRNQHHS